MTFTPDVPLDLVAPHDVIVVPAHASNFGYGRQRNIVRALGFHTPEEDVDDIEFTPYYFARDLSAEGRRASTNYYGDSDGDLFQMVPDREGAFGHGVPYLRRHWKGEAGRNPPWNSGGGVLNLRSLSIEIEGRAKTMHKTFKVGGEQWRTVAKWAAFKCRQYHIPINRDRLFCHEEVDTWKRDPGLAYGFPMDDLVEAIYQEYTFEPPAIGKRGLAIKLLTLRADEPTLHKIDSGGRALWIVRDRTGGPYA